ncbi:MAG: ATP-binding protein, partial [Bacteroidota bacterium]
MRGRCHCLLLSFFVLSHLAFAQFETQNIDSLKRLVRNSKIDTVRIKSLAEIGQEYITLKPDSALYFLSEALRLSNKKEFLLGKAVALNYMGRYYTSRSHYSVAIDHYLRALEVRGYSKENEFTAITLYDIGQLYAKMSSNSPSEEVNRKRIEYFRKSINALKLLPVQEQEGKYGLEVGAFMEIGRAYAKIYPGYYPGRADYLPRFDSAEHYFNRALAIVREMKQYVWMSSIYNDLANLSFIKKDYSKAIKLIKQATSVGEQGNVFSPLLYGSLARYYCHNKMYDSAHYAIDIAHTLDSNKVHLNNYYQILGETYREEGKVQKAIGAYTALLKLAQEKADYFDMEIALNNLAISHEKIGDYKKALQYDRMADALDSISNHDVYLKMASLQSEFDAAKQQAEIDLLSKEAEIKNITIERNRTVQFLIGGILLLSILVIGVFVYQNRLVKKSKLDQEKAFLEVDQLKSRFFANISHEFRTPLTLILAPLERRLAFATSDEDNTEFSVMQRSASRLLVLVNELLDLSRIEAGSMKLKASYQDVSQIVTQIVSQFSSIAASKRIQFTVDIQGKVKAYVDPEKIEKIMTNLLSNAFKFTPADGLISVAINEFSPDRRFKNGCVEIRVSDSGPGIAARHLNRIFDRFYQVDDSNTHEYEGSGIGLALTKELVELHKGTVSVQSVIGNGSTFTVRLPLGSDHLAAEEISTQYSANPTQVNASEQPILNDKGEISSGEIANDDKHESILIIEDNPELRLYL